MRPLRTLILVESFPSCGETGIVVQLLFRYQLTFWSSLRIIQKSILIFMSAGPTRDFSIAELLKKKKKVNMLNAVFH